MIHDINTYENWDDHTDFPFVSKTKFSAYTKILKGGHLKMLPFWGDQSLNRT
jgi:hypothetical protein